VRDGSLQAPILPLLYEFPPDVDWRDSKNWHMVTPNNGRSVTVARLEEDSRQAEAAGEEEFRRWASQHLNVEIGLALHSDRWAGADQWEQRAETGLDLESVIARSEVITVGIDGGGLDDLLGLAVIGRERDTGRWLTWAHAWAHPSALERHKGQAARFRDFERDGDLTIVSSIGEDVEDVADITARVFQSGRMDKAGVDIHGIGAILDAIVERGVDQDLVVGISQGWKLTGSIKTVERKLAEGAMVHGGAPMMNWCCSNAKVEPKGNAVAITKQAAGFAKIDPLMAVFNAAALMALNPQSAGVPEIFAL